MTVLVLDGSKRASLAMVRSLGRNGVPVHVGECHHGSLSAFSKYATESVQYANPQDSREAFVDDIKQILSQHDYEMVLASREVTTLPLSYYKSELETETIIPYPGWEMMKLTVDKSETFKIAEEIGLPTPATYYLDSPDELNRLTDDLEYPLVVKPRSKTTWVGDKPKMMKVTSSNYVDNFEELQQITLEIYDAVGVMPLIQEYIPGDGYGVEALCDEGQIQSLFMHRRLREYPITGGASTYRESVCKPELEQPAVDLLASLEWNGVAMVEFRLDNRDGLPKLMEINGRFWGSLPLAIAAGIEFPYQLYQQYRGETVPSVNYEEGVTSRWLLPGDLLWFVSSLKNSSSKLNTVQQFGAFHNQNYDILSISDPLPVIGAIQNMLHQGIDVLKGNRNLSGEVI
ncbi:MULTISPECIES: ATP-grasp domain-containing protein [Haloferax]|uniref:ATP-grasp domain-containing protein n=1 Tax=Haloferax marinum TaxID=2666143 RepID=A0A6A8GB71_9EURY|nr:MULTISPECIES: ATP-grasp domain-containing protein [Haloferax]KAB1198209.1 ATP-grasp domain-containing protein [Haloferax sp. CBA1150]MRW97296.1 ATP-grasp domain-containing protein [Haloferax marinum]